MPSINENFLKLEKNYLFINIAKKVKAFTEAHPEADIIRMGIGDVTQPIAKCVVEAMKKGADEMGVKETFKGYEDSGAGYDFLKEAVAGYYKSFGVDIPADDIRINDGAKSDCGNIVDIFGDDNVVLITDPAYPVYVDTNLMNGRKVIYADSNEENNFAAMPDENVKCDIIYLCSPNNPTGSVYTKEQLKVWIDYAKKNNAIIIYDSAYEAFITEKDVPRSIFAVEGAKECAIEMCSLSKTAGFTGMRCGYTVIPHELVVKASDGSEVSIAQLWGRREGSGQVVVFRLLAQGVRGVDGLVHIPEAAHIARAGRGVVDPGAGNDVPGERARPAAQAHGDRAGGIAGGQSAQKISEHGAVFGKKDAVFAPEVKEMSAVVTSCQQPGNRGVHIGERLFLPFEDQDRKSTRLNSSHAR